MFLVRAAAAALLLVSGLVVPPGAAAAAPVAAVDSDQPCTRRPPVGAVLQDVGFRPDDLARMAIPQASLGTAARGYEVDWMRYGYMDNTEYAQIELAPSGACELTKTYGRILGFSGAYQESAAPWRYVSSSVHLFFSPADASAWLRGFVARLKAQVGSRGLRSVSVTSLPALGAGAVRLQVGTADGARSWVLFPRGPVVGSVLHYRPPGAASRFDVTALASVLRQRVDTMRTRVAARVERIDAPVLLSLPLHKAALGTRYAGLTWDWFFGGCTDAVELTSRHPAVVNAAYDATRFGRLAGCAARFSPARADVLNGVSSVSTMATMYATAAGAKGALAETVADMQRLAGKTVEGTSYGPLVRFATPALGEEVVGVQQRCGEYMTTSILSRRGQLVLRSSLVTKGMTGLGAEIRRIATALDQRTVVLLARNAA